jgi:plastocyanin
MRVTAILVSLALTCGLGQAAALNVQVRTADGKPVANAVVSVAAPATAPAPKTAPLRVAQENLAFDPFVLVVPAGATVAFPNFDQMSHHVYSFSAAKKFEIQLYGKDEARSVVFPTPGIVAIGCNIHDKMTAFLFVTDTALAAKTDANGNATLENVPQGQTTLHVWHPHATAQGQKIEQAVTISTTAATVTAELDLRAQRRPRHGSY